MIHYHISCKTPASQYIQIRLTFDALGLEQVSLQLPAWRAGRYQLANYAQNIRGFQVFDEVKNPIPFQKSSKDCWIILSKTAKKIQVDFEYWAGKMDAGSSWADEEQVYLNLVNCCFEVLEKSEQAIEVTLDLAGFPKQISTLTPVSTSKWKAKNFQMLADSTILAAKNLIHWEYMVGKTNFKIWIHGEVHFDENLFLDRFIDFSEKLIHDFGEFPEPGYQFIFQLLPYPHYHGVEHRKGTVITFGPWESLQDPSQMEELLGISCHELYHAWNVCRIRPKELLPYDFSKEVYTNAGLILEGVTTYMGDLYLLKSGVFDLSTYLKHFEKVINREAANFGWRNYNILESSFDLWLDGYVQGIPDRKVNIYTRGALLGLCIDMLLLKNGSSLTTVMKKMWQVFGKPFIGYEFKDFKMAILEEFSDQKEVQSFFADFVYGYHNLFPKLQSLFGEIGIEMVETFGEDWLLNQFGIRANSEGVITQIHPESKAYSILMKNDQILDLPLEKPGDLTALKLQIDRQGRFLELSIEVEAGSYFPAYRLFLEEITHLTEKWKA